MCVRGVCTCLTDGAVNVCSMSMYVMSGHSMAETLTVALRVAEEAIEEAITKAEEFSDSLVRRPSRLLLLSSSPFIACLLQYFVCPPCPSLFSSLFALPMSQPFTSPLLSPPSWCQHQ